MTFELTADQQTAREHARTFAQERLAVNAASIDEQGAIAADVLRELHASLAHAGGDATALVVVVEELAAVSAAAAAAGALGQAAHASTIPEAAGLRGLAGPVAADARGRLIFAAVACGVGRAAIDAALDVLRETAPGAQDQEKPHWVVADAATEVEAARMLTLHAAQGFGDRTNADALVAIAKLAATRAAEQAVDAALRVAGPDAFVRGTLLERLTRDVRALTLLMGTEEELRATAAQAVLPG
jgi:alkylation response protein AidB-like acyl-CoA dehydrogenase